MKKLGTTVNRWGIVVRLFVVLLVLGIVVGLRFSRIGEYINLAQIKAQRADLLAMVQNQYLQSMILYITLYIAVVALSLPLAAILTMAGGFLFGILPGAIYANIGATIGATIGFLLVRYLIGTVVQERYQVQLARFNRQIEEYGSNYLLMIHFVAVIPFFLINALAGLTKVSLRTFVWTTSVGIFPGALVYAFAGRQLTKIQSIKDIFSLNIIFAFILLALLALVPVLIQQYRRRSIR